MHKTERAAPAAGFDPVAASTVGFETMIDAFRRGAAGVPGDWLGRMMDANAEMTRFVHHRWVLDREAMSEFARCTTPPETALVCARFCETAMRDYSEEMARLTQLCADQASEAMTGVQRQLKASTGTPDAPRRAGRDEAVH